MCSPGLHVQLRKIFKQTFRGHIHRFRNGGINEGLYRRHHGNVILRRHFKRRDKRGWQLIHITPQLAVNTPSMVLHDVFTRAAIHLAFLARVGP